MPSSQFAKDEEKLSILWAENCKGDMWWQITDLRSQIMGKGTGSRGKIKEEKRNNYISHLSFPSIKSSSL